MGASRGTYDPKAPPRDALLARWSSNRERSHRFFSEVLAPDAYGERPIRLRHPFVFYEGHLAAFPVNTLLRGRCGRPGIDPDLEALFERGIDPSDESAAVSGTWPSRDRVRAYVSRSDSTIRALLEETPLEELREPVLLVLEHEEMHQETLLYMLHRLAYDKKRRPAGSPPLELEGRRPAQRGVRVPGGRSTLGADSGAVSFGWDNEFPRHEVHVPDFEIDAFPVTNADWLSFLEAGGYRRDELWTADDLSFRDREKVSQPAFWSAKGSGWLWRGQFESIPLPMSWPVYVSHAEASAYARWKGRRLPTEAEFHRAAFAQEDGSERSYPWGEDEPDDDRGNLGMRRWDPVPTGSRPLGASAWGVEDLVGNGWEWTSTAFAPFQGFRPMPLYRAYSADFFDGRHFVLKGASPATMAKLARRTFRNWFQPHYPYIYAKFRTVTA